MDYERLSEDELQALLAKEVKAKRTELIEKLSQSAHKNVARAAKKAAYQLRSSGVAIEAKKPEAPAPAALPAKKEEWPALMSVVAGTGEQAMFVVRPQRGGRLNAWRAIVQDETGIVLFERIEYRRGEYRKAVERVTARGEAYELPIERALEELGRGLALNEKNMHPLPAGAAEVMMMFGVEKNDRPREVPKPSAEDLKTVARSATLHDNEAAGWLPSQEALKLLDQRVQEVLASPLQLSETQKSEQLQQKAQLSAKEFFTPEVRQVYAGRLLKLADYYGVVGKKELAELASATAHVLAHQDGPTPFGERLFTKVIDASLEAQAQAAANAEAAAAATQGAPNVPRLAPPMARSPGGLILP
ncbi:MAG: hypothetical protein QM723_07585 [Myxococcaceae bacterium]